MQGRNKYFIPQIDINNDADKPIRLVVYKNFTRKGFTVISEKVFKNKANLLRNEFNTMIVIMQSVCELHVCLQISLMK